VRYEVNAPDRFIVGTVGVPGERTFYIQVIKDKRTLSVAVEKEQVRAIVARMELIIAEIRKMNPLEIMERLAPDDAPLDSPVDSLFDIGAISLSWDELKKVMVCELFEIEGGEGLDSNSDDEEQVLSIEFSLGMAQAFCLRSAAVVNAGRLPCPFCSIPIDPGGHLCPRANGYRR